jgi:hypothetical protein
VAQLTDALRRLGAPGFDGPLLQKVTPAQEAFVGPFAPASPARVIARLAPGLCVRPPELAAQTPAGQILTGLATDQHSSDGMYLLVGPGIPAGAGPTASVYDVAPTVLDFYGIDPPADGDGQPLYRFAAPRLRAPARAGTPAPAAPPGGDVAPESGEGEVSESLRERLEALGYVE